MGGGYLYVNAVYRLEQTGYTFHWTKAGERNDWQNKGIYLGSVVLKWLLVYYAALRNASVARM